MIATGHSPIEPQISPARHRVWGNAFGDDAEQALRAAARSGLELQLEDQFLDSGEEESGDEESGEEEEEEEDRSRNNS